MDGLREELNSTFNEEASSGISVDESTQNGADVTEANTNSELGQDSSYQEQQYFDEELRRQDKRFESLWKTPKDVYGHVQHLEKKYQPFGTILEQKGIKDANGLTEILSKYDEYSDPNSEINVSYNSLQNLVNHPTYGKEFQDFVNRIAEQEEVAKYGSRLPQEVKTQLQEVEQLKQWKQELEQKEKVAEFTSKLDVTCNQIEEFCKSKSYELGETEMKEHLLECLDKQIYGENIYNYFVSKNLDKILGTVQSKTSQAMAANLSKGNKAAVPSGSRITSSSAPVPETSDGLRATLQNLVNKGE